MQQINDIYFVKLNILSEAQCKTDCTTVKQTHSKLTVSRCDVLCYTPKSFCHTFYKTRPILIKSGTYCPE